MNDIKPITLLRNTDKLRKELEENEGRIIITKNGQKDFVILSDEAHQKLLNEGGSAKEKSRFARISGKNELSEAKNAIETLGGKFERVISLELPDSAGARDIIIIKKVKETPKKYPRAFSKIKERPL